MITGEGEAEQPQCGGHHGQLRRSSGPAIVDLDHNEGLDFNNPFDIGAPHS